MSSYLVFSKVILSRYYSKENINKEHEHYQQLRNQQNGTISKLKEKHTASNICKYYHIHLDTILKTQCSGYIVGNGTLFGTHVPIHCHVGGDFISVAILVVPLFAADPQEPH